jgi:hypothetical protein
MSFLYKISKQSFIIFQYQIILFTFIFIYLLILKYIKIFLNKIKIKNKLCIYKFKKNFQNYINNECLICLDKYELNEEICHLKCNCGTIFHKSCLLLWFKKHNNCPICRLKIIF